MAVQSIGSVVNSSFIRSFQGLAGSEGPAIGAGAGKSASIGGGLRLGARTFATAIQNLNSTIGIVNVADDTLKKLSKITDKMLEVVERGTSLTAGTETRRVLQADFEDLVTKFRRVVEGSEISSIEYLTQEGLSSLFQRIGLDKDTSNGVASVFRKFIKTNDDDVLASEETKGKRPPEIPVLKKSKVSRVTDSAVSGSGSGVSPDYSVYTDTNGSGFTQPYNANIQGSITAQSGVLANQTVLAVNESKGNSVGETTGYSLITSTEDLVSGDNPSGYSQVFLVAPDGSVARQVTNFASPGISIFGADISADNLTAAVYYSDGSEHVSVISTAAINDHPATSTLVENTAVATPGLKLSNDGQYYAYIDAGFVTIKQVGGLSDTASVASSGQFGFSSSDTVVFLSEFNNEIYSYQYLNITGANFLASTTETFSNLAVLESDSQYSDNDGSIPNSPHNASVAYLINTGTENELVVSTFDMNSNTLKTRYRRDLGTGSVDQISLTYQNDSNTSKDRVDVGIVGTLSALYGDSDREMYRISENRFANNSSLFSQASADPTNIFDGNLMTRADAYRLLGDLKALKVQIKDNSEALANARDYLADGVAFVRVAGFAFLDISNQIDGTEDATQVAQLVAGEIRKNATVAQMAQVENLRNIATETVGLLG